MFAVLKIPKTTVYVPAFWFHLPARVLLLIPPPILGTRCSFTETRYPGVPDLNIIGIDRDPFMVGDIKVQPIHVAHHKMPVLGFRMGDFTYITDANYIEPQEQEKIKGSKVLVINALRKQKHLSHFTLSEAIELATSLEIPRVYLTHISHQMGVHTAVSDELPANVSLAYDGLQISL